MQYRAVEPFCSRASSASSANDSAFSRSLSTVSRTNSLDVSRPEFSDEQIPTREPNFTYQPSPHQMSAGCIFPDHSALSYNYGFKPKAMENQISTSMLESVRFQGSAFSKSKNLDYPNVHNQLQDSNVGAMPNSFVDDFLAREDFCASSISDFFAQERAADSAGRFICDNLDLLSISLPKEFAEVDSNYAASNLNEATRPPSLESALNGLRCASSCGPLPFCPSAFCSTDSITDIATDTASARDMHHALHRAPPPPAAGSSSYLRAVASPLTAKRSRDTAFIMRGPISDEERRDRRRAQNREAQQRLRRRRRDPAAAARTSPTRTDSTPPPASATDERAPCAPAAGAVSQPAC